MNYLLVQAIGLSIIGMTDPNLCEQPLPGSHSWDYDKVEIFGSSVDSHVTSGKTS